MRKMQQSGAQFLLEGLGRECRQRPRWDSAEKNRRVEKCKSQGRDLKETSSYPANATTRDNGDEILGGASP